jgi:hypothetical protein
LIKTYTKQLESIPIHKQQLSRWQNKKKKRLTNVQSNEMERLHCQLACWYKVVIDILKLAEDWKKIWIRGKDKNSQN